MLLSNASIKLFLQSVEDHECDKDQDSTDFGLDLAEQVDGGTI